jgi:hypothetical protein
VGGEGHARAIGDDLEWPAMGPPVLAAWAAISLSESGALLPCFSPAALAVPSSQTTSSTGISQILAARSRSTWMALRAAINAAIDDEKVPRLPSVMSLWPSDDGVGDDGTSDLFVGNAQFFRHASASEAREPPTSTVPTASVTEPSGVTLTSTQVWPPKLNQKPQAMPRPWFLPSGAFMCGWFLAASSVGPMPIGP